MTAFKANFQQIVSPFKVKTVNFPLHTAEQLEDLFTQGMYNTTTVDSA